MVEILLENYLNILIFKLKVAVGNGFDALVGQVVDVACHAGPTSDLINMFKYDPCILEITIRLHLPNQVNTTT